MNIFESNPSPEESDFAPLLTELADRIASGAEISLDDACRMYPQHETDLRDLWGTLVVTHSAGSFSANAMPALLEEESGFSQALALPCDFGDYVLESEIGRGGMGVVFRATRKADQLPVAIKMILNGEFASGFQRKRFLVEGEAVAKLQHSNIVPMLEVGEFNQTPFICMELINGKTLTELLETESLSEPEACRLASKICHAVHYAHQHGILHRDIKPTNIIVDQNGEPCLLDFGLAKQSALSTDLTRSGAIVGTPAFMSPEQASGQHHQISIETDVYGLGAVLYFMFTGQPPFSGSTVVEVLMKVLEQEPVSPRSLKADLNRDLEKVVLRAVNKTKEQRYPSAQALADDLDAVLNNKPLSFPGLTQAIGHVMRETHHAAILDNWGIIWIWNSFILLFASVTTHMNYYGGIESQRMYLATWTGKLVLWGVVFWWLRRRMGPVTFVERQLAHVWVACFGFILVVNALELFLELKPITLAPLWAVSCSMAFFIKAGILSGSFYVHALALAVCAGLMLVVPQYAVLMFGITLATCFFLSGLKYYRRRNLTQVQSS